MGIDNVRKKVEPSLNKVWQLTHNQAALISSQPVEETSFMIGKYMSNLPWYYSFPYGNGNKRSVIMRGELLSTGWDSGD